MSFLALAVVATLVAAALVIICYELTRPWPERRPDDPGPWDRGQVVNSHQCPYVSTSTGARCMWLAGHEWRGHPTHDQSFHRPSGRDVNLPGV